MKKLLILMIVSMLASTAVFAEGENMADSAGADCGERIVKALDGDSSTGEQADSSTVQQEG
ncbi:MAG: hypothetical protein CME62_02350 [Halobacteriovoraceae bacterium]|nr:hypothetical protein [Halobacteriovoraceae bacterium]|tara:strand:- start:16687 stop:16869 length:183 start_codon:yes stop_codon:yes gene_type:complete